MSKTFNEILQIINDVTVAHAGSLTAFVNEPHNISKLFNAVKWYSDILTELNLQITPSFSTYPGKSSGTGYIKTITTGIFYDACMLEFNMLYPTIMATKITADQYNMSEFPAILKTLCEHRKDIVDPELKIIVKIFINYTYGMLSCGKTQLKVSCNLGQTIYDTIDTIVNPLINHPKLLYIDTDQLIFNMTGTELSNMIESEQISLPSFEITELKTVAIFGNKKVIY
jgi:hypothetical protein